MQISKAQDIAKSKGVDMYAKAKQHYGTIDGFLNTTFTSSSPFEKKKKVH